MSRAPHDGWCIPPGCADGTTAETVSDPVDRGRPVDLHCARSPTGGRQFPERSSAAESGKGEDATSSSSWTSGEQIGGCPASLPGLRLRSWRQGRA